MKYTDTFINNLNKFGKEIYLIVKYDNVELEKETIVSCKKKFTGVLFSTIIKSIELEIEGELNLIGKEINVKFGVSFGGSVPEYVDWGNFIVNDYEYSVEKNTSKLTAYDNLFKTQRSYNADGITYPITIGSYLQKLCDKLGFVLDSTTFTNSTKIINSEKYSNINNIKYKDVFDDIAEIAGASIIESYGKIKVVKYTDTDIVINESNLESLTISEKWGPVNDIVLSSTPQEDNVYRNDEVSIAKNGKTTVRINNNYIMDQHKDDYIDDLFNSVKGLSLYPFDSASFGISVLEPMDRISVIDLNGNEYKTIVLSDSIIVNKGVKEDVYTDIPEVDEIDYSKASNVIDLFNNTVLYVDKQNMEIKSEITKIEETVQKIDTTYYHAELTCSGTSITRDNSSITMSVQLLNKSDEVPTSDSAFNWKRVSSNSESDTAWNNAHKARKSITITSSDLEASANFYCDVSAAEWQGSTSAVTVVDETKVPQLGNSFLDVTGVRNVQTLNTDGSYSPSWAQTNPIITPSVIDGVLDVSLNECAIEYKRLISGTERALEGGETVKDGILTISKNVLSKALTAITYVAYITYKGVKIKLFTSFSLNVIGQDGNDGNDGQDGKDGSDGKGIVSRLIYHAVSTSDTVAPTTGWTTATITRSAGQYLWKKEVTRFSDGTEDVSAPVVISGDKGDTGKGIKSYAITYQASTSGTTAPTGTWSSTIPTVQQGQYLWSRTITTYTDDKTSTAYSVSYIPINGTSVSVKSTSVMYQVSTNGTTEPTGEWKSSIPTVPKGQYLWTRTIVTYTDDKSTTAYSVSYQPVNGSNGTSVTVSSTKTTYQASNSGTTVPTGTWSDTPVAGTAGQYVWTRTIVTYSDGKSTTSYSISRNGNNGATGATGTSTASTVQQYFLSTSKINPTGGTWTTTPPTWSSGKYLWTRFVITYKNPASTEYTVPVCDSSWEAVNEIEVGGRNLLLKSNYPVTNTSYPTKTYTMTEKMVANETYTCTLWGTLGTGKSYFGLWLDGGNIGLGSLVKISDGIYQLTFKGKTGTLDTSVLHVYPVASTVSAESTITKIKLEKGNKPTDWSPAPEDINQDIVDAEVRITESYNSAIKLKDEEIRQFVTKSVEEVGDWESALNTLRNEVVLTKDSTEFLKTSSQIIKDLQTGKVDINEIKEWARFTGAILELGASNSEYKVKLSPTELGFYQGNTKVAWISNNELNVTRIVAGESVTIKTFIFVDEGSYGFTLKKVGG